MADHFYLSGILRWRGAGGLAAQRNFYVAVMAGFGIEKITGRDVTTPIIEYVEQNARRGQKKDKIGA